MATWTENRLEFTGANVKYDPMPWQLAGLTWTATGYGDKIPTRYKVWTGRTWRRVYCRIFSNAGTCYIVRKSARTVVDIDTEHADSQTR